MSVHAYQAYRQTQIATASQGELLLMLFDGAIRFAKQAKEHMEAGKIEAAHEKLLRTQAIINELELSLNLDVGEIAHNLQRLYGYVNDLLIQANVKKDPTKAADALKMLQELRDTWESVVSQTK